MIIESVHTIVRTTLSPEQFSSFQEYYTGREALQTDVFECLKTVRRFFMVSARRQNDKSWLAVGLNAFQQIFEQKAADPSSALIHEAYFHEYLGDSVAADECLKRALNLSNDMHFAIEKVTKFYVHFSEGHFEPDRFVDLSPRAKAIFATFTLRDDLASFCASQVLLVYPRVDACQHLKDTFGDNDDVLARRILSDPSLLDSLLENLRALTELIKSPEAHLDIQYLDQVILSSLRKARNESAATDKSSPFICQCSLLLLLTVEVIISARGDAAENFSNYAMLVRVLEDGRRHGLQLIESAKRYYERYSESIERAISLGEREIAIIGIDNRYSSGYVTSLADIYRVRGELRKRHHEVEESQLDYRRAIELFKYVGQVIYNDDYLDWDVERLAECYLNVGDYQSAIEEYLILFNKTKKNKKFQALLGIGKAYSELDDLTNAERAYRLALEMDADGIPAYDGLQHVYRKAGKYEDAIACIRKIIEIEETHPDVYNINYFYFLMGEVHTEAATNDSLLKARDIFLEIVTTRQPDSLIAYSRLVSTLIKLESYSEAAKWLRRKIEIEQDSVFACVYDSVLIGDCYSHLELGEDPALEAYRFALKFDPNSLLALGRLAKWHEQKGDYPEAIVSVEQMLGNVEPQDSDELWNWLGKLKARQGDFDGAVEAWSSSLAINAFQPDVIEQIRKIAHNQHQDYRFESLISQIEPSLKNSPSPELVVRFVDMCLAIHKPQYADKAEQYLAFCNFPIGGYASVSRLADIHEIRGEFDLAISLRQTLEPLGSVKIPSVMYGLNNIRFLIELIRNKRRRRFAKLIPRMRRKFLESLGKAVPNASEEDSTLMNNELVERNDAAVLKFREQILFIARELYSAGYYFPALDWIRRLTHSNLPELSTDKVYLQIEGEILFALERDTEAESVFKTILKNEGYRDAYSLLYLGIIKKNQKAYRDAISYLDRSMECSEDSALYCLDQKGKTYVLWAQDSSLTVTEILEKKRNAIDCYTQARGLPGAGFDRKTYRGLAYSYLLNPVGNHDVRAAAECYRSIIRHDLSSHGEVTSSHIDRITIKDLLLLWSQGDHTIKDILLGRSALLKGFSTNNENFVKWKVIQIAKREGIFTQEVFDTLKGLFPIGNSNIKKHICQYFMRYLIFVAFTSPSEESLTHLIKDILAVIQYGNKKHSDTYLTWFLSSEQHSYLPTLISKLSDELKKLERIIDTLENGNWLSNCKGLDNCLSNLKSRLNAVGPQSYDAVDVGQMLDTKEDYYRARLVDSVLLSVERSGDQQHFALAEEWSRAERNVFETLHLLRDAFDLNGTCDIRVGVNEKGLTMRFVDRSAVPSTLLTKVFQQIREFAANPSKDVHNRGERMTLEFSRDEIVFPLAWTRPRENPFPSLFELVRDNRMIQSEEIEGLNEEISKITEGVADVSEAFAAYTLNQIAALSKTVKAQFSTLLTVPHELTHILDGQYSASFESVQKVRSTFKNIHALVRECSYEQERELIALEDVIRRCIDNNLFNSKVEDKAVVIRFTFDQDDSFPMNGNQSDIEAVFMNLLSNSFASLARRLQSEPIEPTIEIELKKSANDTRYEIAFSDNGIGIQEGLTIHQLAARSQRLGLNIIISSLQRNGGTIEMDSQRIRKNMAVTFVIGLPVAREGA